MKLVDCPNDPVDLFIKQTRKTGQAQRLTTNRFSHRQRHLRTVTHHLLMMIGHGIVDLACNSAMRKMSTQGITLFAADDIQVRNIISTDGHRQLERHPAECFVIPFRDSTALGIGCVKPGQFCSQYRCLQLAYKELDDGKYKEIVRFFVTDDNNHVPVRLDMHLKFGSAKAFLVGARGVKSQMKSVVK